MINVIISPKDMCRKSFTSCLYLFSLFLLIFSFDSNAQEIKASVDTTTIRIGEQITYSITVETTEENLVVFPEGQTFSPLELIESYAVDTTRKQDRLSLLKEYALTQFDSGSYTIPQQRITINDRNFFTDSMLVEVRDVEVDTTKQNLYPIKPSVEVPPRFGLPLWAWVLIGVLLLAVLMFFFYRRKKKKEEAAKKLPPYEQAIFELQQLDNSHLLEQREIKEYYSQLSAAVRRYLDGEVFDHAMESTSGELIAYLEAEKTSGRLNLKDETIDRLKRTLERADLAKFANTKPDVITAREDRSNVELVINDTKAAKPQPTEEELLKDQEYRKRQLRKKRIRKIVLGITVVIIVFAALTAYVISTSGFSNFKDTYFGHPTKELLEEEWIRSDYGNPPVVISTPRVLKRVTTTSPETFSIFTEGQVFSSGAVAGTYYIEVSSRQVSSGEFDPSGIIDNVLDQLEEVGARNIITKEENFTTVNGAEGLKIFGSLDMQHPTEERNIGKKYTFLSFSENVGIQQIMVIYDEDDRYAEEVTSRILNSIEFNAEN